ncbi:hypothetical protein SKAU_G00031680 [Synaphobranchus kaupii]|uniref:Cell cycle checkpoint control protein n=1 Tax=Synaphobranchus kaupii TaxID=118154 RepID=A0A9Q1GF43_SYNKA|nr:hypothetical protein SKAU_G00031680 [Synaphobranchus kaupii]
MDCMVTGGNVKVLAKAIHSLSRIGEELYLEPQEDGLALRTVNSSRSAYACFLFSPLFFQRYSSCRSPVFRCKMAVKSVQAVFRSLSSLEKTVERCRIELNSEKSRITFTLHCKHGLLKTHNLSFQDCESLQAVFDRESCANVLRAQPRLMVDTVLHFPSSLEEVSVSVQRVNECGSGNHVEEEAEHSKAMLTELCLSAEEFEQFTVSCPTRITFCLKEMRGLLMFAESSGLPVSLYFDEPGRPVVLRLTESVLEVNFVLATLSEDSHPSNHKNNNTERLPNPAPADDFMNDDIDSYLIAMETSELAPGGSGCAPPRDTQLRARATSEGEEEEEEEMGRPANKKFRSLFFGSMLPTSSQVTNQTLRSQEVLASDSENEEEGNS